MKKVALLIMIGLTSLSLVTGCNEKEEKNKEKQPIANTNEDVVKDQTLENFKFENTSLVYYEGTTTLETTVTNMGENDEMLQEFKIVVKDKEGKEMITLVGFVGATIKAGETKVITSSCGEDLSKAVSIEYSIER